MHIIRIEALENGAHSNQRKDGVFNPIPDGWAVVPEDMAIPETYPFVDITVENGVVTSMTAGVVPEPEPEEAPPEYVTYDQLAAAIAEGVNDV